MAKAFTYKPQDWQKYDPSLNMDTNIELGGVATPEKMDHIEEGLVHANMPIVIELIPSDTPFTTIEERDGKKYITVMTDSIEPKQKPITITINPSNKDTTEITESKSTKDILVNTTAVEPRWPDKLVIDLIPGKENSVEFKDKDNTRTLLVKSKFLNEVAIKPQERDIVIYEDQWIRDTDGQYYSDIEVEAEILPSSFIKITKGLNITRSQLEEIRKCKVQTIEELDGSLKAIAQTRPTIDIPLHVSIL